MKSVKERFLEYVTFDTQSSYGTGSHPSTAKQFVLASRLWEEMKAIGLDDIVYDDVNCYLYGTIPSTLEEGKTGPVIGFIAHMDTSPDAPGADVKARVVEHYDGQDLVLNEEKNIVLSTTAYPEIRNYEGKTLIVTDGTTLLGGDDKAGVAEIMTAAEYLISHPEIKHGPVRVAFTSDEEIGEGVDQFSLDTMKADYAFTVDGGGVGELEYENFNAADAMITIKGVGIHPGEAKNKMINAALIAAEYVNLLPESHTPAHTEGYEGFIHLHYMKGDVDEAKLRFIIRDHDMTKFLARKSYMEECARLLNAKYQAELVTVALTDSYYNMREKIYPDHMHLIDNARLAYEKCGVEPKVIPIRGGTDGARLSFMGLPCPNMFTGGHNFHGVYEYICLESMESMVNIMVELSRIYGEV